MATAGRDIDKLVLGVEDGKLAMRAAFVTVCCEFGWWYGWVNDLTFPNRCVILIHDCGPC